MNVGIIDLEIYVPKFYVNQIDLERSDGCPGKYEVGLGQCKMTVPAIIEDSVSMALTVVHRLMKRRGQSYRSIGRIDVGTESSVDLSKSIKSYLMDLFEKEEYFSVEGADNINACYGGTAALFNVVNWVKSGSCDGRLGLVIASDIAIYDYKDLGARATGGAAAVCILVGSNPVIEIENIRGHFMTNQHDFYKPLHLKFPQIDAKLSLILYIKCLIGCFSDINTKLIKLKTKLFDYFDFFAFHSPYTKLAAKGFAYLAHFVALNNFDSDSIQNYFQRIEEFHLNPDQNDRKIFEKFTSETFEALIKFKLEKSLELSRIVGNCYTASVFLCLVSTICHNSCENLLNKRIGIYSYGSGSLSSLYSMKISSDSELLKIFKQNINQNISFLDNRTLISPKDMSEIFRKRFDLSIFPQMINEVGSLKDILFDDTFYLSSIDEKCRRNYKLYNET